MEETAQVVEVAVAGRWDSPDAIQRFESVGRKTLSVRPAFGMTVPMYDLQG